MNESNSGISNTPPVQTDAIDHLLEGRDTAIARDLKLNLKRLLTDGALNPEEALLALLATATSVQSRELAAIARIQLRERSARDELIREAEESAAIMAMLNTYYRFRHMLGKEEEYRVAGLRMTALARPAMGKERFEMLAFAVSVLNGCENCIKAHEQALRAGGASAEQVHDLARLAAVVRGFQALGIQA